MEKSNKSLLKKLGERIKKIRRGTLKKRVKRISQSVDFANVQLMGLYSFFINSLRPEDIFPLKHEGNYVLFSYPQAVNRRRDDCAIINIGDYVQTLAVRNALSRVCPGHAFEYWDRDNLLNYFPGDEHSRICVMQGFFPKNVCDLPNKYIFPIFIGFHLGATTSLQYPDEPLGSEKIWRSFIRRFPTYFRNKSVGCRDHRTELYLRSLGIDTYFSRCLALTFPLREKEPPESRVFVSCSPNLQVVVNKVLPREMRDICVACSPEYNVYGVREAPFQELDFIDLVPYAERYLQRFKDEATLVITDRVHVAGPCIAMGIPTIIIRRGGGDPRYDVFRGIAPCYTEDEVMQGRVDFTPQRIDIESLKTAMLENVKLTIEQEAYGVPHNGELKEIRRTIESFVAK